MPSQVTRLVTIAFVASLAACSTVTTTAVKNTTKTFNTVVVDAGHGGKDSGAYRRYGPPEKMVALDVAQRLNRKLRESAAKNGNDPVLGCVYRIERPCGNRECSEKRNLRQHTL